MNLRALARLAREERDERAQNGAGSPEPLARDFDDSVRPPGFAQLLEHRFGGHRAGARGSIDLDPFQAGTKAPAPARGRHLAQSRS